MEDGEVEETYADWQTKSDYKPEYEWPAHNHAHDHGLPDHIVPVVPSLYIEHHVGKPVSDPALPSASLRLLVRTSSIIPKTKTLAVIDGFSEVQIGRDIAPPASEIPRIRLKEMEVSKLHATIYWDRDRKEWSVVDMGSKHGTFLRSAGGRSPSSGTVWAGQSSKGTRLSAPRASSTPRPLRHGDELSIGGTTLVVHVHGDRIPCVDCSPLGGDEIDLFEHRRKAQERESAHKRKHETIELPATPRISTERDPKRAITMLKRSLLSRHNLSPVASSPATSSYLDRSARRRALHPDATPISSRHSTPSEITVRLPSLPSTPEPVSAPPPPLPSSNIGHRLLMKQGWQPGTALGTSSVVGGSAALTEPLDIISNTGRSGLGSSQATAVHTSSIGSDWKEAGKMRRWADVRSIERNDP